MEAIWAEKGCIEYHLNKTEDGVLVMIETVSDRRSWFSTSVV
jgi:hypothetical protein